MPLAPPVIKIVLLVSFIGDCLARRSYRFAGLLARLDEAMGVNAQ
jgi:hypothetical protein